MHHELVGAPSDGFHNQERGEENDESVSHVEVMILVNNVRRVKVLLSWK